MRCAFGPKTFFSTISNEILKKREIFYNLPSILISKNKNLPSVFTPTLYRSRVYDLLDTYPYLIAKENVELIELLENLSEFHIPLGDRQNNALKAFLRNIIDTKNTNQLKIAAIRIYTKLINDSPSYTIRSTAILFAFADLTPGDIIELLQTLIKAKAGTSGEDLNILESDLKYLLEHLFLSGKLQFLSSQDIDIATSIRFIYLLYTLYGPNDYVQYALGIFLPRLDSQPELLDRDSTLELIEVICNIHPLGSHGYLRRLACNIIKNKYKLSDKQFLNIKNWFSNACYRHDFFNSVKLNNEVTHWK